jgi:hypothetical protein
MRVITLNLLAEEQLAQEASARDPFKVAIALGVSCLLLCSVAGSVMAHYAEIKRMEAEELKAKWEKLGGSQSQAGTDTQSVKAVADELLSINQSRQLYAPQLALLKDLIPDSIQLQQVAFLATQTIQAPAPAPVPEPTATGDNAKPPRPARPKIIDHLLLQLTGRITSVRPEIEIDEFIQSLRRDPVFSSQVKEIKLQSIARNASSADGSIPMSAQFMIECQYKDHK